VQQVGWAAGGPRHDTYASDKAREISKALHHAQDTSTAVIHVHTATFVSLKFSLRWFTVKEKYYLSAEKYQETVSKSSATAS
jgi:hypothetical protein